MQPGGARQAVLISLLGASAVVIASGAMKGKLPSGRRIFAFGVIYVGLAAVADTMPKVAKPMAGLVFVAVALSEGVDAARGIGAIPAKDGPLGTATPEPDEPGGSAYVPGGIPASPASPMPAGAGGQPVAGGTGGNWGGSKPIAEALAAVTGLSVSSTKRATKLTASGNVSDHYMGLTEAYATDLPVSTLAQGDKAMSLLMAVLGDPGFKGGSWWNRTIAGFRIQVGWRVKDHFDHIHIGVRKV